jgi:DNA-binding transcriptional regulator YiaG
LATLIVVTPTLEALSNRARASLALPDPASRRAIRRAAGVSLSELAAVVGVTKGAVQHWERGRRRPTGEHLERYVAALTACRGII